MFEAMFDERSEHSGWLYQRDAQVFGPVSAKALLELLYDGTLDFETLVAPEAGEFKPARRYGVFRSHQAKVRLHRAQVAEATRRIRDANRRALRRRIGWSVLALGLLIGGAFGLRHWILHQRQAQAEAQSRAEERALQQELDALLASVTLEPPLEPLFEPTTERRTQRRRRRRPPKAAGVPAKPGAPPTEAEIRQGVAKILPGFKRCIVAQMQRNPDSVGSQIVVSFSVDNRGRARNVRLADRFLRRSPLKPCMARQLAGVRWRAYEGEVRNIDYPIRIGRT